MVAVSDVGEIPLRNKHVPTANLPKDSAIGPLVTLRRANVNIQALQERLRLLEETMGIWDPANQVGNVPIRRAGHDAWGIDKIMLVFCDDYMKGVYEFPWLEKWLDVLQPLFDLLDVPLTRVVRCLLARMPADADIPVHNDTGYWVDKCHRIHVPVFTDPAVDFQVGRDEASMVAYDFAEGNIYELNNASKHKVHNYWSQPRVHLIFDYVDAAFPIASLPRVKLTPDMVLHQTRRSVDVSTRYGTRVPPSFVIIGAQKAGTTSLYDYITQHDLVVPSIRKETHYLDWRWDTSLPPIDGPDGVKKHKAMYSRFFRTDVLLPNPSIQSGEATPSYMLGGSIVIQRFKALMEAECKILVVLRNPVDRAFSHYNMTADTEGNAEQLKNRGHAALAGRTFDEIVASEIAEIEALGIDPDTPFDEFDKLYLRNRVNFTHGGHSFVGRGLYALQLAGWYQSFPSTQIHVVNMDDMKTSAGLQGVMDSVYSFLDLPPYAIQDASAKNTRAYAPLSPATRQRLEAFYAPFNAKLRDLVGGQTSFSWVG